MKNALAYLLLIGVTATVTWYLTARHFSNLQAQELARAQGRWQAEKARLQEAIEQANARAARARNQDQSIPGKRPPPQAVSTSPPPALASSSLEWGKPVLPADSPAAGGGMLRSVPRSSTPLPASLRVPAWTRYEQTLPGKGSACRIDGTSSIHDWSMETPIIAGFFEVDARCRFDPEPMGVDLQSDGTLPARAQVRIPVRSLKSYNAKMDQVYRQHMEEAAYRNMEFRLTRLTWASPQPGASNGAPFAAQGELAIHGVTNAVTLPVSIQPGDADTLRIHGGAPLTMTAFGVQPPAPKIPGMPAITTGDDIMVTFEWVVRRVGTRAPAASEPDGASE
ncbi:MAG: YceI family protein [Verrucomicrobia bacterium]|nr:YceI family protein [Verrucomicrobiota bacterium]